MPYLPRLRPLLLLLALLAILFTTLYLSRPLSDTHPPPSSPHNYHQTQSPPAHTDSWSSTSSFLFPASAIISLSDDNNTFFISRPAAFGPQLPKTGLEGELYVLAEGQFACDDAPGWDPTKAHDPPMATAASGGVRKVVDAGNGIDVMEVEMEDDGTDDNLLNPDRVPGVGRNMREAGKAMKSVEGGKSHMTDLDGVGGSGSGKQPEHADIESLQQTAEISGKIVLVARGGCGFLEKVLWTQRRGGIALIVGDYKRSVGVGAGGLVTMYAKGDTSNVTIPSLFTSYTTASLLTTLLPKPAPPSPTSTSSTPPTSPTPPSDPPARTGLWLVLTPTTMTTSPFFDTLLVLVVSPLITLTVVYTLLLVRSRIRRRRWRAPKSVVERLPIRTYHTYVPPPTNSTPPAPQRSLTVSPVGGTGRSKERSDGNGRRYWSASRECVVCLEEYVDGVSKVMRLPCGHEFHAECITPWLTTRRRTCPICKGDVVRGAAAQQLTSSSTTSSARSSLSASRSTSPIPSGWASPGPFVARGAGVDERTPLVMEEDLEEGEESDLESLEGLREEVGSERRGDEEEGRGRNTAVRVRIGRGFVRGLGIR